MIKLFCPVAIDLAYCKSLRMLVLLIGRLSYSPAQHLTTIFALIMTPEKVLTVFRLVAICCTFVRNGIV